MENKITQKTESPTLILAHRLKKIKQRLINCKSIEEEDITEIGSIVSMLESQTAMNLRDLHLEQKITIVVS